MRPVVVKLGGSVIGAGTLGRWLAIIAEARRPVAIVAGGGRLADAVRAAQRTRGFDEETAHRQAILAMEATGAIIAAATGWATAETLPEMKACWQRSAIVVWRPCRLCRRDATIPRDWTITSDGIAVRLAERLGEAHVAMVKSCETDPAARAGDLAAAGIVDGWVPKILDRSPRAWSVVGANDHGRLRAFLAQP